MQDSPKHAFNKNDLLPLLKSSTVAILGALLAFGTQYIPSTDFGRYTPFVTGAFFILGKAYQYWTQNNADQNSGMVKQPVESSPE